MVRHALTTVAFVALGLSRDPGCGGVDDPNGGTNAPCTRSSDCGGDLVCSEGVCRERDAGRRPSDGRDSGVERDSAAEDAEADGG